jgi:hypothetical protein
VISDPAGGLVSNASVILFSAEKVREVRTDRFGQFAFVDLPHGIYELQVIPRVSKQSFSEALALPTNQFHNSQFHSSSESTGCGDFQPTASYPNARKSKRPD